LSNRRKPYKSLINIAGKLPSKKFVCVYIFNVIFNISNLCYELIYNTKSKIHLAKEIRKTKATTTVLIDKLEKYGFIERKKSDTDLRTTNVFLTEKGEELQSVFEEISQKLRKEVYKNLTEKESGELERLLEKMI